jgi:hypothetical protein
MVTNYKEALRLHFAANPLRGGQLAILGLLFMATTFAQPYFNLNTNYMFACDHSSMVLQLINVDPGWQVDYVSSSDIANPSHVYDPVTGELTILGTNLTGPKSYGTYTFDLIGADFQFNVYVIACCLKIDFDNIIITGNASDFNGVIAGETVLVLDQLTIDVLTNIDQSTLYFGADAKIDVNSFQSLTIQGSTLKPFCEFAWDGVFAQLASTSIQFINSGIEGSARGFNLTQNVDFSATNSQFLNNHIGLGVFDFTQGGGPYLNNTFVNLSGNAFLTNAIPPALAAGSTINMSAYTNQNAPNPGGSQGVHIYCGNSTVRIGAQNNSLNTFNSVNVDDVFGVYAEGGLVIISHNTFNNLAQGILGKNTRLNIGGSSMAWGNTFTSAPIYTNQSSQHIRFCDFNINANTYIEHPTNAIAGGISGTRAFENNYNTNSDFEVMGNFSTVNVVFESNTADQTKVKISNTNTASLNAGVKVIDNWFFSNTSVSTYSLYLTYTEGARVGNNKFSVQQVLGGTPIPILDNHGMRLDNVRNAQIKNNTFEYRDIAIYSTGTLDYTMFSCNTFFKNLYGLYLENVLIADQGSATAGVDNIFVDFSPGIPPSQARMYLNNVNTGGSWSYYYTDVLGSNMDPYGGVGVTFAGLANFNPVPLATSTIAECGTLNKSAPQENQEVVNNLAEEIIVFPNPTTGLVNLKVPEAQGHVRLLDVMGHVLLSEKIASSQTIILLDIPKGMYLLEYSNQGKLTTQRLIIQ